jgi:hypothetical protein
VSQPRCSFQVEAAELLDDYRRHAPAESEDGATRLGRGGPVLMTRWCRLRLAVAVGVSASRRANGEQFRRGQICVASQHPLSVCGEVRYLPSGQSLLPAAMGTQGRKSPRVGC